MPRFDKPLRDFLGWESWHVSCHASLIRTVKANSMRQSDAYLPLDAAGSELRSTVPDTVAQFLTLSLLGAREAAQLPSNHDGFDEDVNVYLVGLLARFLESTYHEQASRYVHSTDLDLADAVRDGADERLRFRIYKTNADHLLLAIGLFHQVDGSGRPGRAHEFLQRQPIEFIGRGSSYYHMASSSLRRLRRRPTAQELALSKLGDGFESYVAVLRRLRSNYFHLVGRLGEGSLFHLARSRPEALSSAECGALYDRFLDALSAWRDAPDDEHYAQLEECVRCVREAVPEFTFEMPQAEAS
jgi:hypothetical protein